ncbi:multicopper oxidase domain-containing protein [Arthrobacter sp. NPDC055138]
MKVLEIHINDGYLPMVDGSLVYHRGYGERRTATTDPKPALALIPHVFTRSGDVVKSRHYPLDAEKPPLGRPEPAYKDPFNPGEYLVHKEFWASIYPERGLIAEAGSTIRLRVTNHLAEPHALQFVDAEGAGRHVGTGRIAPGQYKDLEFEAPAPGTYVFCDPGGDEDNPTADPVQRILGLYGALLVTDPDHAWRLQPDGPEFERQWLWILHNVDPQWARLASRGQAVDPDKTPAFPRYFTLNGRAGFQSLAVTTDKALNEQREEDSLMSGSARSVDVRDFSQQGTEDTIRTGQLMRFVNAGVVHHQLHFHGNHLWTVRRNGTFFPRSGGFIDDEGHIVLQQWEDVVEVHPLDRKDSILPLRRPPEATDQIWDARAGDWHYPMHCHAEPSQIARGGMYPGGLVGHWTIAGPAEAPEPPGKVTPPPGPDGDKQRALTAKPGSAIKPPDHKLYRTQVDFSSDQIHEGSPKTEFRLKPDRSEEFDFFNRKMEFDDGAKHEMWTFQTRNSGRIFPAPLIRITEGQVFHGTVKPSKKVHTIHWHGMEPDPRNDGVGHTSFEVSGHYTYQWRPEKGRPGNPNFGASGTYFYHCHVNTTLHVQMGMFGPLIIDPYVHPNYPISKGARRAFVDGPEYDIETETILVPYSLDPRWHELNHAAGLSGEDVGLDDFRPKHFYLVGGNLAARPRKEGPLLLSSMKANVAGNGRKPTLLRLLNANYYPVNARFTDMAGKPVRMAELISHDGRAFRDTSAPTGPALPIGETDSPLITSLINFGAAERYDMLLRPPKPGKYKLTVELTHWITTKVLFKREITITAS